MRSAMNQASPSPPPSSLMAGLAQSFMPPSHYNPHHRPAMPARSVSNMSELSMTSTVSQQSDDFGDLPSSRPTTPSFPSSSAGEKAPPTKFKSSSAIETGSGLKGSRSSLARPIAIEVPKMTRLSSAPVYTPPEPLSARGDLPGGYFPLHEDPKTRVRRTHPFQPKTLEGYNVKSDDTRQSQSTVFGSLTNQGSYMSVTPYFHGSQDNPMPLGKYYPTNYEKRKSLQPSGRTATSSSSSSAGSNQPHMQASETKQTSSRLGPTSLNDDSMRRKMQKYQHDMMAQTARALGNTAAANTPHPAAGMILNDMAMNLAHAASQGSLPERPDVSRGRRAFNDGPRARTPPRSSPSANLHGSTFPMDETSSNQSSSPGPRNVTSTGTQTLSDESQRKVMEQHKATQAAAEASQLSTHILVNDLSVYLNNAVSISPVSPKLIPLGSPGPVTPMELESFGHGESCQSIDERLGRSYQ